MKFLTRYPYLTISIASLLSTFLVWFPFISGRSVFWTIPIPKGGFSTILANFDGLYYLVISKSWYASDIIKTFEFTLPVEYYAAHYPFYPLLISALNLLGIPLPYGMILVTVIFSLFTFWLFYHIVQQYKLPSPLWLTMVFLIIPARWLAVRTVGSPEPIFIFLTIATLWSFTSKRYWLAAIAGSLALLTKSPGILMFVALGLYAIWTATQTTLSAKLANTNDKLKLWFQSLPWAAWPMGLIPLTLLGLFFFYGHVYGSFWAYFESGDNLHLFWPPFQMFNRDAYWVGDFWLEDIIWILLIYGYGVIRLWKRQDLWTWYAITFFSSILFVSHRDIARYVLPLAPLMIMAYAPFINTKSFKILVAIVIIPIFLYAINFIAANTMQISNWAHFL